MSEHMSPIPSRIYNAAVGGHVCGPEDVDFGQKVVHLIKYDKAGNEVSFESQVTQANKIYVIHDDFTLSSNVTIPANCVLEFDGGSLSGAYTLNGTNTDIIAAKYQIFGTDVIFGGSFVAENIYPEYFGGKGDGVTDNTNAINKALEYLNINGGNLIFGHTGSYCTTGGHIILPVSSNHDRHVCIKSSVDGGYSGYSNPNIIQTSDGVLFWFRRDNTAFIGHSCIKGLSIKGHNTSTAIGIKCSDMWNFTISDCYMSNFGICINPHNYLNWTENLRIENIHVRSSYSAIVFNKETDTTATDSFYCSIINNVAMSQSINGHCIKIEKECHCYQSSFTNIIIWAEGGGVHKILYITGGLFTGLLRLKSDGWNAGIDHCVEVSNNGYLDAEGNIEYRQSSRLDQLPKLRNLLYVNPVWASNNELTSVCRIKGLTLKKVITPETSFAAGSVILVEDSLISRNNYKVRVAIKPTYYAEYNVYNTLANFTTKIVPIIENNIIDLQNYNGDHDQRYLENRGFYVKLVAVSEITNPVYIEMELL